MSNRILNVAVVSVICVVLLFAGCGKQAELSLKFGQDDTAVYKVFSESTLVNKLAMPSNNKFSENLTRTSVEMTFDQEIEGVDEQGVATAKITIQAVKILKIKEGEVELDYDSEKASDKKLPLTKLIGKSYRISIDPKGKVKVVDAKKAAASLTTSFAGIDIKALVSDKVIVRRHEVLTLANMDKAGVAVGDTWSTKETPPYKMLSSMEFEKVYKLEEIKSDDSGSIAVVSMKAIPTGSAQTNPASMMAAMAPGISMDSKESFVGSMTFDVDTGRVLSHEQVLTVATIAIEVKAEGKEPNMLTITQVFTEKLEIVK